SPAASPADAAHAAYAARAASAADPPASTATAAACAPGAIAGAAAGAATRAGPTAGVASAPARVQNPGVAANQAHPQHQSDRTSKTRPALLHWRSPLPMASRQAPGSPQPLDLTSVFRAHETIRRAHVETRTRRFCRELGKLCETDPVFAGCLRAASVES